MRRSRCLSSAKSNDSRRAAIHAALSRLTDVQLLRILGTPEGRMVCDEFAYDAATGRF